MFDRGFQKLWNAANVRIHVDQQMLKSDEIGAAGVDEGEEGREEDVSIIVSWDDCDMADYFCQNNPSTVMEYTAEISPETEIPIKSFQYYKSLGFLAGDTDTESLVVRKREKYKLPSNTSWHSSEQILCARESWWTSVSHSRATNCGEWCSPAGCWRETSWGVSPCLQNKNI